MSSQRDIDAKNLPSYTTPVVIPLGYSESASGRCESGSADFGWCGNGGNANGQCTEGALP